MQVKSDTPQLEVLKQDCVSISTINIGTGSTEFGITVFETAILGILDFYGVSWNPVQIREAAEMLFSDYYWMSLSELKHFSIRVKKADFGKITEDYSKFAPKHLMQCANVYGQEALYARGQFEFPKPEKEEDPNAKYVDPEVVKQGLKAFAEELGASLRAEQEENEREYQRLKALQRKADDREGEKEEAA